MHRNIDGTHMNSPPLVLVMQYATPRSTGRLRPVGAYPVFMKNITLSVDEKVLAAVRRYSAERESSVNALVREFLTGLAETSKDWARKPGTPGSAA